MSFNPVRLRFIKDGSPRLPLRAIDSVPQRLDLTWYGQAFAGDAPLTRMLEGRVHGRVCYRYHEIRLYVMHNSAAAARYPNARSEALAVFVSSRTGLGTQHFQLHCPAMLARIDGLLDLPDDALHAVLHALIDAQLSGARYGYQLGTGEYRTAFVEGRLKKRKVRGANQCRVEIAGQADDTFAGIAA